ncbi:MAG: DNA methyltransferase, partial [Planctomycetota bacterium]
MAEKKNTDFKRPGGYAMPTGATQVQRKAAAELVDAEIRLYGDSVDPHVAPDGVAEPAYHANEPDTRVFVGDCRDVLATLPDRGSVDLIFADPPFNWDVPYENWDDGMSRAQYERFTYDWLDGCIDALAPHGSLWVNIPDDTCAEIVMHLKRRGLVMVNWCVWHFRFGQHRDSS